ncbi:MAG: hypothetical protein GEU78_08965 [Actinobacteria bacterium]|nr:hypothetical protein [Actinomycetota bacterium]
MHRSSLFGPTVVGVALVIQPVAGLIEHLLDPKSGTVVADHIAAMASNPDGRLASILVGLLATVLFVPIALGLAHLVRSGAPRLGLVGGGLALIGVVGYSAMHGADIAFLEMVKQDVGQTAAVHIIEGFEASAGGASVLALFLVGMFLGTLLLALALWRTRSAPRLAAALIAVFLVVDAAGAIAGIKPVNLVAHTLLIVGSGWIGLRVLAMTDEEWLSQKETVEALQPPELSPENR